MIFLPLETELFYYEHLLDSTDILQLIKDFFVKNPSDQGLERYIKVLAAINIASVLSFVWVLFVWTKSPVC